MASSTLYLSDNSWVAKRQDITDDEGATPANGTLTARCYLSDSDAFDAAAIHASLDVSGVAVTGGKIRAVFVGSNVRTHVTPLLVAAETAKATLTIYEHVVIAGNYHDVNELSVKRKRRAGLV